jgi:hypothetical protein
MLILVDIDHTISDAAWRDGMIENESWDAYHMASIKDPPVQEMVNLINAMSLTGHVVYGFTARPEKWRKLTMDWMVSHEVLIFYVLMRNDEDFRPADQIKTELVDDYLKRITIDLVIDDREDVCLAFKARGITTLQVSVRGK